MQYLRTLHIVWSLVRRRVTRRLTRLQTMYNVLKHRKNDEIKTKSQLTATATEPNRNRKFNNDQYCRLSFEWTLYKKCWLLFRSGSVVVNIRTAQFLYRHLQDTQDVCKCIYPIVADDVHYRNELRCRVGSNAIWWSTVLGFEVKQRHSTCLYLWHTGLIDLCSYSWSFVAA